ncbi:MAG TPA: MmcQ/YjbR family DNA-binding protein [Gemmatimonadaceae bacterium]|nr:MmcQ/YjbR family DNA-binding protein [Gemmatimonadaceae bacterium]
MPPSVLTRVRRICLALQGAHEKEAWGEPTWRVCNKVFAMFASASNHHGAGQNSVWVNSTQINQEFMMRADPKRFFSPPYAGPYGWVGIRLDGRVNWKMVAEVLGDGYELTVAKLRPSQKATLGMEPRLESAKPGKARNRTARRGAVRRT